MAVEEMGTPEFSPASTDDNIGGCIAFTRVLLCYYFQSYEKVARFADRYGGNR